MFNKYTLCLLTLFAGVSSFVSWPAIADQTSKAAPNGIDCQNSDLTDYPIHVSMNSADVEGLSATGSLSYNDHPHALLACNAIYSNLSKNHTATCAGVYDLDFDENGNPKLDTVVVVKFTDTNGKLQATFNAPVDTPPNHPQQPSVPCVYQYAPDKSPSKIGE
jgi:hypothetical protein